MPEDFNVSRKKMKSCFPRTLSHTAGENNHIGTLELRIVAGRHTDRVVKGGCVEDIFGLRLGKLPVRSTRTISRVVPLRAMA